jgi:hypothetical protein
LQDNANIEEALQLFMYGTIENGTGYDEKSLYYFLTTYKTLIDNKYHDYLFITAGNDSNKGTLYSTAYFKGNCYPKDYDFSNTFRTIESQDQHIEQNLSINNFMAGLMFSAFIGFFNTGRIDYISRFDDSNKNIGQFDICSKILYFIE